MKIKKGGAGLLFKCPGCNQFHTVSDAWSFNSDFDKPTLSPSVLVSGGHYSENFKSGSDCWCTYTTKTGEQPFKCERCHSFINDGMIQFLNDCTHEFAGKTIELPELQECING